MKNILRFIANLLLFLMVLKNDIFPYIEVAGEPCALWKEQPLEMTIKSTPSERVITVSCGSQVNASDLSTGTTAAVYVTKLVAESIQYELVAQFQSNHSS
jgi:hypothetical protein